MKVTYTLTIVSDCNYRATTEGRCDVGQYAAALGMLEGEARVIADIVAERLHQVNDHGHSAEHDDTHVNDEIAAAACFYAMPPAARDWDASGTGYGSTFGEAIAPADWTLVAGERRQDLVKAAAMLVAEIERLDRANLKA